jgi:hypothetical protein
MNNIATKRRSQRLFLQVRVIVEGRLPDQKPLNEDTHTVVVNAHGALVEMTAALDQGQIVVLRNVRTGERIDCKVMLVKPVTGGKFSTAFEFVHPNPDFWRISFPPEDWSTRHLEPKKPQ